MNNTIDLYINKIQAKSNISTAFKELILPELSGNVLDVGFGNGDHLRLMRKAGLVCEGIDGSKKNVEKLKSEDFKVQLADFNKKLPIVDSSIDTFFCSHVLEHLESPYLFLLEANRVIKFGGKIIIGVPLEFNLYMKILGDDYFDNHEGHLYAFSTKNMVKLFSLTGFRVIKQYYNILLLKRIGLSKLIKLLQIFPRIDILYGLISNEFWTIGVKK